jgi:hypothetical protein
MLGRQNLAGLLDELSHQPLNRQMRRVADLYEITGIRLGELITGHVTLRLVGALRFGYCTSHVGSLPTLPSWRRDEYGTWASLD